MEKSTAFVGWIFHGRVVFDDAAAARRPHQDRSAGLPAQAGTHRSNLVHAFPSQKTVCGNSILAPGATAGRGSPFRSLGRMT